MSPEETRLTPSRQPMKRIRMVLACPAATPLDVLDAWMESALEIDLEPCICFGPKSERTAHDIPVIDLAWRCLLVARSLLQAAGIPAFDPGAVLHIEQDPHSPSRWVAVAGLAHIDEIPEACYALAVDAAIKIVRKGPGADDIQPNGKALFGEIENQTLQPMRRMIVSGKSTIPILQVAFRMDIPFMHLGAGVYQLGWGSRARRVDRSSTEKDALLGAKLAQHKVWAAGLLRTAGLPAPEHGVAESEMGAIEWAHRLGWPVVVKPADLDRGEGVTIGIGDDAALAKGFRSALELSKIKQVLVERQAPGVCHRILVANDEVLYAVKRLAKAVVGDGRRTVVELIAAANGADLAKPPWLRSEPFPNDAQAVEAMQKAGFSLTSVPAAGWRVPLRPFDATRWGGDEEDISASLHPDNRALALRAAALFDLQVAGIDLISPDIAVPWYENGAVINEVNFAPTLGDGPLSRECIPLFLEELMGGDGRIPIEVYVGGDRASAAARVRQQEWLQKGRRCFLTSPSLTLDAISREIPFMFQGLFRRCRALLIDRRVDVLVLVVQTDEWLDTGLPVDRFTRMTSMEFDLTSWRDPGCPLPQSRVDSLLNFLKNFVRPPKSAAPSEG